MPFQVTVKAEDATDGRFRELAENQSDQEAEALARSVSQVTGEKVTLTPFVYNDKTGQYDLDEAAAKSVHHVEAAEETVADEAAAEEKPKRSRAKK